ncbi:tetratricopeptide repeat protein [Micromonospora coerulea]|uniref:tetratricopeptide repeat protein n=1 Tax=Micromonospora coerulea TaxID=47856 RepID=UPI001909027A|nr:tetratricopeptide repeat protein [Micromonospora veneta]
MIGHPPHPGPGAGILSRASGWNDDDMSSLSIPQVTYLGGHPDRADETRGLTAVVDRSGILLRRPFRRFLTFDWAALRGLEVRTPGFLSLAISFLPAYDDGSSLHLHLDRGVCRFHVHGVPAPDLRERLASWVGDTVGPPAPLPAMPPPPPRASSGPLDVVRMSLDLWRAGGLGRESLPDRGTLAYRLSLAEDHRRCGRYGEAIALLEPLAAGAAQAFGPVDEDTLKVRNALGQAYLDAGQVDDGLDVLREVVAVAEHLHGVDGALTLVVRNNLAIAYQHAGQYAQAIELHEQNIRHTERNHGRDSIETIGRRNNLAATLALAGYRERAIELYWEVLDALPDGYRSHTLAVNARQNLAILHNPSWTP